MTKQAAIEKLSLNTISEAVKESPSIREARERISIGVKIDVDGVVLKKITRHEYLRLFIQPDNKLTVFAEFIDPNQVEGIKKGSKVSLTGSLVSFGFASVCLTNCKMKGFERF